MHEVRIGGIILDCLSGEERENTTYEGLRQGLAMYFMAQLGFDRNALRLHVPVPYTVDGETHEREADLAVYGDNGNMLLLLAFCPGQVHTFKREITALARLVEPCPCSLAVVTDTRDTEFFAVRDGTLLGRSLDAIPDAAALARMAGQMAVPPLAPDKRAKESRILHAYTGFLKTCCGEGCPQVP